MLDVVFAILFAAAIPQSLAAQEATTPARDVAAKATQADASAAEGDVLAADNLVAWCIVPFDAKKRTPEERAAMLSRLGIKRCAYDWREQHVPEFEAEIQAYKKHNIEFFAFWGQQESAFQLFQKYDLHPQIWQMIGEPVADSQAEKVQLAAEQLLPLAKRTAALGCRLAIYNHGGWGGEPANMVAVCERLNQLGQNHVGIVYNYHHGHSHIEQWPELLKLMQPHLVCVNLNGMNEEAQPKILGIGQGEHELAMIRTLVESDYAGPIGILDHREQLDAEKSLAENLQGIDWIQKELIFPGSGGPAPSPAQPDQEPAKGPAKQPDDSDRALAGGRILPGSPRYRQLPLTIACRATLTNSAEHNVLVANETKRSTAHWEMFSVPGSGNLTAYLPGCIPDHIRSSVAICDSQVHTLAMIIEEARVRLFVDGNEVANQNVERIEPTAVINGALAIGRTVENGIHCTGEIEWVKISRGGGNDLSQLSQMPEKDDKTIGLWHFAEATNNQKPNDEPKSSISTPTTPLAYDPQLVEELLIQSRQQGNFDRGADVFASANFTCMSCHRVGDAGGTVGPELSAIMPKREPAKIVESLFWPQRDVDPQYRVWKVVTVDGEIVSGTKVDENATQWTLVDSTTGRPFSIPTDEIEDHVVGSTSMPDGLASSMSYQQQLDLLRFLIDLGKDGKVPTLTMKPHQHAPEPMELIAAPNETQNWPNHLEPINQLRIYDFYTKQAEHFRQQDRVPRLLSDYPSLDGTTTGHWGNQDEATWSDGRWNDTVLGSVQSGVFVTDGLMTPRGVCVQLGDHQEMSICFNTDTLIYDALWRDGFVSFSSIRHGFMNGLQLTGTLIAKHFGTQPDRPFEYHGFYRVGKRIVFSYQIGGVEYFDAPWVDEGAFTRELAPVEQHSMRNAIHSPPRQWPQTIETKIHYGAEKPFAIDTIELPLENPWDALMFCGGHDFLPDGSALLSTMQGDVWRVRLQENQSGSDGTASWQRFASGLHHPLGLRVVDGKVFVQCRDQLTQLHDTNDDGEADFYECFSQAFETSPAGHDYICGLQCDAEGNFYMASGNQGLVKISSDGQEATVLATGFRNPDGLGIMADGTVTLPCSEGDWTPASMICAVQKDSNLALEHFGYGGPRNSQPPALPLAYLPRGIDNSSGEQALVTSEAFGPLKGTMIHTSFGASSWFSLLTDDVNGQQQGAIIPMRGDFTSGVHRARFNPNDGQLYLSGMNGWGSYATQDGCFQRVRYTHDKVQTPIAFHVFENGVRVTFSQPIDSEMASQTDQQFAQCWNYRYSGAYGSPEYSPTHPGVKGHDGLEILKSHILKDGCSLFLEIPRLQPVNQLHLRLNVNPKNAFHSVNPYGSGHDLFITVHQLDRPFTNLPNYRAQAKVIAAHPILADMALNTHRRPNPWREEVAGARPIEIKTGSNLSFQTRQLRVKANEPLAFTLSNPDVVPHNWVLVKPDHLESVGKISNQMIADPTAFARHYIPDSEYVLNFTDVVSPGSQQTIFFNAPATPGRYPFLCTFPGHWMVMNGDMIVE
jgi:putative heme-binding domain-containing protein